MEALLSGRDINGDLTELCGYVQRSLPDAKLDQFVERLASRIATFDKQAIASIKRPAWLELMPSLHTERQSLQLLIVGIRVPIGGSGLVATRRSGNLAQSK